MELRPVLGRCARLAAVGVTACLFATYVAVGHGVHAPNDGMKSMHGDGICLVLFTVVLGLTLAGCRQRLRPVPAAPTSAARACASPAHLQVFRR